MYPDTIRACRKALGRHAVYFLTAALSLTSTPRGAFGQALQRLAIPEAASNQRALVVNRALREAQIQIGAVDAQGTVLAETTLELAGGAAQGVTARDVFEDSTPQGIAYLQWTLPPDVAVYVGGRNGRSMEASQALMATMQGQIDRLSMSSRGKLYLINPGAQTTAVAVNVAGRAGAALGAFSKTLNPREMSTLDLAFHEDAQTITFSADSPIHAMLADGDRSPMLLGPTPIPAAKESVKEAACAKPSILTYRIDNGASSTNDRDVRLNNSGSNSPREYRASQSRSFSGAPWRSYDNDPSFRLSAGDGRKVVYLQLRNSCGTSSIRSDTIQLNEPIGNFVISAFGGCSITQPIIEVSWTPPSGSPTSYDIFRNGVLVAKDFRPSSSTFARWRDNVGAGQKFTYVVRAKKGTQTKDSPPRESSQAPLSCR